MKILLKFLIVLDSVSLKSAVLNTNKTCEFAEKKEFELLLIGMKEKSS